MKKIIILVVFLLSIFVTSVQSQDLSTDRPGVGNDVGVVPINRIQLETGFSYSKGETSYNNSLLRYGVSQNIELRLNSNYVKNSDITGFQPFTIGVKMKLFDNKFIFPAISLISQFELPFLAKKNIPEVTPSYYLLFSNKITSRLTISYNVGAEYRNDANTLTAFYTLCPTYDLGKGYSFFVEGYRQNNKNGLDFGFAKNINNRIQMDLSFITLQDNYSVFSGGLVYLF